MITLVEDFIAELRSDLFDRGDTDDTGALVDILWSDEELLRYINDAASQWAADTLAYRRMFSVTLEASQPRYKAAYDVIEFVRIDLLEDGKFKRVLHPFNLDEGRIEDDYGVRYVSPYDLVNDVGTPRGVTLDRAPGYFYVYPAPVTVATLPALTTLDINAVVYPRRMFEGMPLPSENRQDLHLMKLWAKKLAYEKQDADSLDLDRAKAFENEYYGKVPTRKHEYDRAVRGGGVVRSRW